MVLGQFQRDPPGFGADEFEADPVRMVEKIVTAGFALGGPE